MRFPQSLPALLLFVPTLLPASAASLDFAVSVPFDAPYTRFGADPQGNILIAANPTACSLPTVKPLYTCGPVWIAKLDSSAQHLLFATYLGHEINESIYTSVAGIAADSSGNIVVAAHTNAQDMPAVNAFQPAPGSAFANLYIARLASDGSHLLYATYLGGSGGQTALSLAVDHSGSAYIAASVNSTDFPTTKDSYNSPTSNPTAVVKLDPNGSLVYSALFPFEFYSEVHPIVIDAAGHAVLVSNLEALIVAPDGSSIVRATYPQWATLSSPCSQDALGSYWCAHPPFALPRSNGGLQFAGAANLGVPVTADALQIFAENNSHLRIQNGQAIPTSLTVPITALAADPQNSARVYAATSSGLYASSDNGVTWRQLHDGAALAIVVDPFNSDRLFLSVDSNPPVDNSPHLYRSIDAGATWTAVLNPQSPSQRVVSLAADPNTPGLFYGAGQVVIRSKDGGDTWDFHTVGPSMPNISPSAVTSTKSQLVHVDLSHPGWAYVEGINNCIGFCPNLPVLSRTQDGGNTWADLVVSTPNPSGNPTLLAVDPHNGDVVNTPSGAAIIYRNGAFHSSTVLFNAPATAIAFDPSHPGTIYLAVYLAQAAQAGFAANGYWVIQSTDDGATWTPLAQFDRPVYNLTVSAGGVLQASQDPLPSEAYFLTSEPTGNISYGTYFGAAFTQVTSMAGSTDRLGTSAFVGGATQGGLPLVDAFQSHPAGGRDAFVAVFADSGAILWSTYLGGSSDDTLAWLLPLPDGSVIAVGTTASSDFPSLQPSPLGAGPTFLARLRP